MTYSSGILSSSSTFFSSSIPNFNLIYLIIAGKLFLIFGLSAIKTVASFGSSLLSNLGSKNSYLIY